MIEKIKEKQQIPPGTAFPFGGSQAPNKRIVFMGTPDFAVASLEALVNAGLNIVAVITAPDKPAGRGMEMQQSAVKKFAVEKRIPVLQPVKLKDPAFIEELRSFSADLQIVVAFRMLPEVVWNMPPLGTINLHGSLLPQYRGAAPINWAVINGEKTTGVTTFLLKHEIDTGNVLLQQSFPISEEENAGSVHDRMKLIGADLLVKTVNGILQGSLEGKPQAELMKNQPLHHAPKIFTETCEIKWDRSVDEVNNLIRGLSPYPGAFTMLDGKKLKIFKGKRISTDAAPATVGYSTDGKTYLRFPCRDGWIDVLELQIEGKRRMHVFEFLKGYRFKDASSEP